MNKRLAKIAAKLIVRHWMPVCAIHGVSVTAIPKPVVGNYARAIHEKQLTYRQAADEIDVLLFARALMMFGAQKP